MMISDKRLKQLQKQWNIIKPKVIKLMQDGWSNGYALSSNGIHGHQQMYKYVVKQDEDFIALMRQNYQQSTSYILGYTKHLDSLKKIEPGIAPAQKTGVSQL